MTQVSPVNAAPAPDAPELAAASATAAVTQADLAAMRDQMARWQATLDRLLATLPPAAPAPGRRGRHCARRATRRARREVTR